MEKRHRSRTRINRSINAAARALMLPLWLAACGGGGELATQSSSGGGPPSPDPTPSNSAVLAWDAVFATSLSGYRVYYGTAPGTYIQSKGQGLSVGDTTTYTITGLSNGTTYYFAVTAFDTSNNESSYSDEVSKAIP